MTVEFAAEPVMFSIVEDVFRFAGDEIGQRIRIEQPTVTKEGELPVFGFGIIDVIQSTRYFDQTEQAVIYFENGGSVTVNIEALESGLRFYPEKPNTMTYDTISEAIREGITLAMPYLTNAISDAMPVIRR